MGGKRRKPPNHSSPTIRDVARRAGVSAGTVSNVLIGVRGVRTASRVSVLKAAEALGYKSNHMASSLRRGHTRTIGVVVPDLSNEFFTGLVTHWEAQAAKAGYEILVVSSGDSPETETRRIQSLITRRVDGLLIIAARDDFGAASGFPTLLPPAVLVDRASGHKRFDTVASDNVAAGYEGTMHLIRLGHRDIVLVTSDDSHLHLRERVEGYRDALKESGLAGRERVVIGGRSVEACRVAIEQEFRRTTRPTAVFASTFFATLGAIKAIHAFDIALPGQISLVGFEHSVWATVFQPYLTAVAQRREDLAATSWSALMDRIGSPNAKLRSMKIPVNFSVRDSARQLAD